MTTNVSVFQYENCESIELTLHPGLYLFEAWGGEGGLRLASRAYGGKGGYSRGELILKHETVFFLHIGQKGYDNNAGVLAPSACNGGGRGYYYAGGGGGGSDVRVLSDDLFHRILVAGGGGGTGDQLGERGGYGGGLIGGNGEDFESSAGRGGNQEDETTKCADGVTTNCPSGIFGYGGNASTSNSYAGGGGGGWFGGSASNNEKGGGGGSGYILTELSHKPSNYFSSNSDYCLHNTSLLGGNELIPLFDSESTELGHSGHGAIRITQFSVIYIISISNKCEIFFFPYLYSLVFAFALILVS